MRISPRIRDGKRRAACNRAVDTVAIGATALTPQVGIQTHLFVPWSRIAKAHAVEAEAARAEACEITLRGGDPNKAVNRELDAALVSVCAAAFAIDALYGAVLAVFPEPPELRQRWKENRTPRRSRIIETLKRGFRLGSLTNSLPVELDWLFVERRDKAVHFPEAVHDVTPHSSGVYVAEEHRVFSADAAARAIKCVASIFRCVADQPKARPLQAWVLGQKAQLLELANDL